MLCLILAVLTLLVVVAWVFRTGSRSRDQQAGKIPFEAGDTRGGA